MKQFIFFLFLSACIVSMASCTNEDLQQNVVDNASKENVLFENQYIKVLPITTADSLNATINLWDGLYSLRTKAEEGFHLRSIVKINEMEDIDVVVKENGKESYIGYYRKGQDILRKFYISINKSIDGSLDITYTDADTKAITVVQLSAEGEISSAEPQTKGTMDCITDAYSNHGWASVALTIQSAFLPETVVAIAAACAVHNL